MDSIPDEHEHEHASMVTLARLEWLAQTFALLRDREAAHAGAVDPFAAEALHSTAISWSGLLRLDVPA